MVSFLYVLYILAIGGPVFSAPCIITSQSYRFASPQEADSIGLFLASFKIRGLSLLVVRLLQFMDNSGNNEFDCSLLSTTNLVYCVSAHAVHHPVSVLLECGTSCEFVSTTITRTVERECVTTSGLESLENYSTLLV